MERFIFINDRDQSHAPCSQWCLRASQGQAEAQTWVHQFATLGEKLLIHAD
jgi:hypothetical protein